MLADAVSLSIIIPALNEETSLPATLRALEKLKSRPHEVILVDGGSTDRTVSIAKAAGVSVIQGHTTGRAIQMNAGAAAATGSELCFLHADTLIPEDFVSLANDVLSDSSTALAGFISIMCGEKLRRFTTAHNFLKTWYAPLLFRPFSFLKGCRLLFGDQVMICRQSDFEAIGGFDPAQAIMEEADLCIRMVRAGRGRVRQINRKVWSSDRRVSHWGPLKANLTFLYIGAMWGLGAPSSELANHYEDTRQDRISL